MKYKNKQNSSVIVWNHSRACLWGGAQGGTGRVMKEALKTGKVLYLDLFWVVVTWECSFYENSLSCTLQFMYFSLRILYFNFKKLIKEQKNDGTIEYFYILNQKSPFSSFHSISKNFNLSDSTILSKDVFTII